MSTPTVCQAPTCQRLDTLDQCGVCRQWYCPACFDNHTCVPPAVDINDNDAYASFATELLRRAVENPT